MKKVRYVGDYEVTLPILGKIVNKDDEIDVPDDFVNAKFEEVVEQQPQVKEGGK